ncbi:hypothetical protein N7462_001081 [Penicillium macrosclerotiorum]|uniref:uncharacterized protein n=1 Tax=Penicillium macrosclerotiorum TaxID=303699 RepID=UPI0025499C64|nr:uncharacterized protein N7462_001081 [Penicillium macrosclerotiorum]KAJ5699076.1 hypothetical protein N7462_001081 [Penicillium macrosclerotiorum]
MDQAMLDPNDPHRRRQPLTDASSRINHAKSPKVETPSVRVEDLEQLKTPDRMSIVMSPTPKDNKENQRLSVATDFQTESARNSVVSAASILSNKGKRKTHVGPWQLGRTLGKGATGRVRLAKHAVTGQTAAIKIVSKKSAAMVQSESIAAMDRNVGNFSGFSNARQMPCGIEREVVIMKLIEHQNVISLYDVWENRGELYLVLEYVEGGELFDYVSNNGPLPEEEAVRLFRQIIAGLGYCHRFNICHRDLKPENILLDANHNVKLADFGMAALQPAGHWLNTSCGSPHYAAPEIIYGRKYRGDRADMWSCGIILYALLTGYLPFDGGDLPNTLRLVKKGDYMIPPELSDEAADLIQRILQKRPEDRITMQNIWLHPLLTKYEKLHNAMADHYIGPPPPLSIKDCGNPVTCRQDVDYDILRNLQTLWHDVKPDALIDRLLCIEPTHERMFYNALVKFRDEQLENYQGQPLEYSASDYHHISRPGGRVRRGRSQNGRTNSKRRTHASIVKDLHHTQEPRSCGSVESYDPYRSPKIKNSGVEPKYAQITIHRARPEVVDQEQCSPAVKPPPSIAEEDEPEDFDGVTSSPFTVLQKRKHKPNSMKSFQSSKIPNSSSRCPGLSIRSTSYRRNVSFHHVRNRSQGSTKPKRRKMVPNPQSDLKRSPSAASLQMIADCVDIPEIPSSPPLPAQPMVVRPSGVKAKSLCRDQKVQVLDFIWKEDARKVSNELSQICEEAFNGSSVTTMRTASTGTGYETPATPVSVASQEQHFNMISKPTPDSSKATSKESGRSYSIEELTETRRKLVEHSRGRSDNIPTYLSGVIGHLDRLIEEDHAQRRSQRRMEESTSTLVDPFVTSPDDTSLPVISEEFASPVRGPNEWTAMPKPKAHPPTVKNRIGDSKTTIRMVPQSSLRSMEEVKPLMIRKKPQINGSEDIKSDSAETSRNFSSCSRQSRHPGGLDPIEEVPVSPKKAEKVMESKKWSWFKHRSQVCESPPSLPPKDRQTIIPSNGTVVVHTSIDPESPIRSSDEEKLPTRKTSMERFGGALKKLMPKKSNKNAPQPETGRFNCLFHRHVTLTPKEDKEKTRPKEPCNSALLCKGLPETESSFESNDPLNASIPPRSKRLSIANQNWFARVFQIKPASRVIALNTSKVRGRKEVYKLLRDWKQYGMENVYMDKSNSIVHGQVSDNNLFRLREVEFTAEFYTVLEHGRKANLSLVRFKQERGAASSFNKVVENVHLMLQNKDLVVEDPVRAKKMSRVLDTIPKSP